MFNLYKKDGGYVYRYYMMIWYDMIWYDMIWYDMNVCVCLIDQLCVYTITHHYFPTETIG